MHHLWAQMGPWLGKEEVPWPTEPWANGKEMKVFLFSFICFTKILHALTYQSAEHAGTMLET